jgi:hypothetical protein
VRNVQPSLNEHPIAEISSLHARTKSMLAQQSAPSSMLATMDSSLRMGLD